MSHYLNKKKQGENRFGIDCYNFFSVLPHRHSITLCPSQDGSLIQHSPAPNKSFSLYLQIIFHVSEM